MFRLKSLIGLIWKKKSWAIGAKMKKKSKWILSNMKNVKQKVMLYLSSLNISLQFHANIFCWNCALYCEIVKFARIDRSGTPCMCCTHLISIVSIFNFQNLINFSNFYRQQSYFILLVICAVGVASFFAIPLFPFATAMSARKVIDNGKFNQRGENESGARAHPNINGFDIRDLRSLGVESWKNT